MKKTIGYFNIILLVSLFTFSTNAQSDNWKKNVKTADEMFAQANYASAAEFYTAAWKQKPKKKELIYKAGESFYIIKDYQKAAEAFKNVKEEYADYPLIGLKYARALKQAGDYDAASRELVYFLNNYKGTDKDIVSELVQNEIRGAELGIKLSSFPDEDVVIQHLSSNINTPETEFAPFAFNDETMYYSSTMAARAEIYRSLKVNGEWSKPEKPGGFPKIENDHFCNGNLSPDNKRFYFTICKSKESWGGLTTECDLFVIKHEAGKWNDPERLRDYVNIEGSTTTHPFVVHQDNTEVLYFASNREGGKGGMDIWYMTRDLRSDDIDFTFPINAGSKINTKGDEITPFYDQAAGSLYYSSNGLVTIGGFDIFEAQGSKSDWETPRNIGTPLNSSADDFFFVRTPSRKGGFFSSNRMFGAEKISTTDEDIFSFTDGDSAPKVIVKGNVVDEKSNENLTGIMVSLSQYMDGGRKQFIANKRFDDGNYYFEVLPGAEYELEAQKEGFLPKQYVFSTRKEGMRTSEKSIKMERVWGEDPENDVAITPVKETQQVATPIPEKPRTNVSPKRNEVISIPQPTTPKVTIVEDAKTEMAVTENVEKVETVTSSNPPPQTTAPKVTIIEDTKTEMAAPESIEKLETVMNNNPAPQTTAPKVTIIEDTKAEIATIESIEKAEAVMNNEVMSQKIYAPKVDVTETNITTPSNTYANNNTSTETTYTQPVKSTTSSNSTKVNLREGYDPNNKISINRTSATTERTTYTAGEGVPVTSNGLTSSAPRHEGTYYKVQLIAVTRHDPSSSRYNTVRGMARMDTELIEAKNVTRVLLADYFSYADAKEALSKVKQKPAFARAYLVKYRDGERVGRVN